MSSSITPHPFFFFKDSFLLYLDLADWAVLAGQQALVILPLSPSQITGTRCYMEGDLCPQGDFSPYAFTASTLSTEPNPQPTL